MILSECKLHIINDILVEPHWHIDILLDRVSLLQLLDPDVELLQLVCHQTVKVLLGLNQWRDETSQEGKE